MRGFWISFCLFWVLFCGMVAAWLAIDGAWVGAAFNLGGALCWAFNLGHAISNWERYR